MAGAVASPPAHLVLRESTRAAHEAAEETAGMRRLLAGELDAEGYAALLEAQWQLFGAWERSRGDWLSGLAGWGYVSRARSLEADLAVARPIADIVGDALHGGDGVARADTPATLAPHPNDAAHWGELYVVEGSALGGRVIVRRLRELYPHLPHHFYAVGEDAPSRWRRFQGLLDAALAGDDARATAVDAARAMFARFQRTLQDPAA
ncbi:MAG: biliverdin-producing heme oxygenase [Luteibacter sp.]